MNTVKFKIKGYDEATQSLIVSFASDTTANQDPDAYSGLAFQPLRMWPDVANIEDLKKSLARVGMHHAELQEKREKKATDPTFLQAVADLVGQTYEYPVADLVTSDSIATPFLSV